MGTSQTSEVIYRKSAEREEEGETRRKQLCVFFRLFSIVPLLFLAGSDCQLHVVHAA